MSRGTLELWITLAHIVLPTQNKNQSWLNNQSRWKWDRSIMKLMGMLRLRMYGWVERAKKWHLPVRHNKEWFFMFFHFWMCAVRYHEEGSWNSTQFCTLNATSIRKVRNPTKSMKNSIDAYGSYSPMSFRCLKFINYGMDLGNFL